MSGRWAQRASKERGIALLLVMWIVIVLALILGAFSVSMRAEVRQAQAVVDISRARAVADGAVQRAAYEMLRPNMPGKWRENNLEHHWLEGDAEVTVRVFPESARIDLNTASDALLIGLLKMYGGFDDETAPAMLDKIIDWRDADDNKRPHGAEKDDYIEDGREFGPTNRPFATVDELQRVMGMTPIIYARLAPYLTVGSGQSGLDMKTVDRATLMAIPNIKGEDVDKFIADRTEAIANNLPPPAAPVGGEGYAGAPSPNRRIRAEVKLPGGTRYVRNAVAVIVGTIKNTMVIQNWSEEYPNINGTQANGSYGQ